MAHSATDQLTSSENPGAQFPHLPACQFCHHRKIKCDDNRPKCGPCTKHGEDCVTLRVDEFNAISREYIGDLEQKIKEFQSQLAEPRNVESRQRESTNPAPLATGTADTANNSEVNDSSRAKDLRRQHHAHSPSFIEGGGISFMRHLFTDSSWRDHDSSLLQNLSKTSGPAEAGIKPNALPPAAEARVLFDKYLSGSNIQNPFLLRRDVQQLYHLVFSPIERQRQHHAASENESHNLFRTFMILAIASVLPYRQGIHSHHPYGYFLSAMQHLDDSLLSRGLHSIQDLLLVGRFGIYHHIGISIWEITRLCMRMCIEQNLHKPPSPSRKVILLEEQLERRVFWESYMIDRYSSITLDRPFAMTDSAIKIALPADANDEELDAADATSSFPDLNSFCAASMLTDVATPMTRTTEISVFSACVRLRQITSKIHLTFQGSAISGSNRDSITARGAVYASLDQILHDLQIWRRSAPVFESPSCLYEMQEWYDLLCFREQLLLSRKALDLVPKPKNVPPRDLVALCLQFAVGAITGFCRLFERKQITFTRSYFQMLFTGGLSIMFCLSVVRDFTSVTIREAINAITQGQVALQQMGEELPDAKRYVAVYEALGANVRRKCSRHLHGESDFTQLDDPHMNEASQKSHHPNLPAAAASHPDHYQPLHYSAQLPTSESFLGRDDSAALYPNVVTQDTPVSDNSLLPWDLLNNDSLWDMEAGLNEYAYGDPPATLYLNDPFDLSVFQ